MKPRGRGKGHMVYQTNQLSSVRQVRASVVEGYNPPRVIRRRGLCLVERDSQPRKYELVIRSRCWRSRAQHNIVMRTQG